MGRCRYCACPQGVNSNNNVLNKAAGDVLPPVPSLEEGVVLMYVTYDNLFTFVLMIIAIITLVKSFYDKHKK